MDILILGGGAGGLMAALWAAENKNNTVTVLERQERIGRKLLATGNGRCNLTNMNASLLNYHGQNPSFASFALDSFSPRATVDFFRSLGLVCQEQYGGRVYPLSDSSNSVLDVLRFACSVKNISIVTSFSAQRAAFKDGKFFVFSSDRVYSGERLVVACGGKAGGKLGGTGDGYEVLKSFGHKCTKLYPALTPVNTNEDYPRSLKGIRCDVEIKLNGKFKKGELQFTDNGISGPAAFDISRDAALYGGGISIDFLTGEIEDLLLSRRDNMPDLECGSILTGIVHNRLSIVLVKYCGLKPSSPVSTLSDEDIKKIAFACHDFRLSVKGVGNFDNAQITVGGIETEHFNPETMESLIQPGLFACGEVLDIDGDCGGYNLQWAWSSGYLAGMNASL